jgi:glucosamine kinase
MIIGIDGGGSRSEMIVADNHFVVQQRIKGPSLHALRLSETTFASHFQSIWDQIKPGFQNQITHLAAGLAGAHSPRRQQRVADWFVDLTSLDADHIFITSDIEAAHRGAFNDSEGLMIILGTGSVAIGRFEDQWITKGGYGYKIGDEASGYDLGRLTLNLLTRHIDGVHAYPVLVEALQQHHPKLNDRDDVISWVYSQDLDPAALAPVFLNLCEHQHTYESLLLQRVDRFLDHLEPLMDTITARPTEVCLGGGLMKNNYYKSLFFTRLQGRFSDFDLIDPAHDPAVGAALAFRHQIS